MLRRAIHASWRHQVPLWAPHVRGPLPASCRRMSSTSAPKPLGTTEKEEDASKFGKHIAGDDTAPAQMMHDISKGRFEYIGDFMSSLNRGPVKLDFGDKEKPISEKQKKIDELNERNLKMIQRSLVIGTALAGLACWLGWQVTKFYYGVKSVSEFADVMRERMPKVSGNIEDGALGRKLKESSEASRDSISENKELTDWRRSLRSKFNTPEGAQIARANSITLAEKREAERILRKSRKAEGSTTALKPGAEGELDDRIAAAATVAAADVAAEDEVMEVLDAAAETITTAAQRVPAIGEGPLPMLERTTSRVLMAKDQATRIARRVSIAISPPDNPPPSNPATE